MHLAQLHQSRSGRGGGVVEPGSPINPPPGSFQSVVSTTRHLFTHRSSLVLFFVGILVGVLIGHDSSGNGLLHHQHQHQQQSQVSSQDEAAKIVSLFPLFHPAPHGFASSERIVSTQWTQFERRLLKQKSSSSSPSSPSDLLSWDWVNLRSHINALPALSVAETVAYLRVIIESSRKKNAAAAAGTAAAAAAGDDLPTLLEEAKWLLSGSTHDLLSAATKAGGDQQNNNNNNNNNHNQKPQEQFIFPVFLQTKYGYQGVSVAVVGGLYDAADAGNLKNTAVRELKEELGLSCAEVTVLGRFIVDGNRGCGQFQTHMAKKCSPIERTSDDKAAADLEKQKLIFLTREDLVQILHRTQQFAEVTPNAIPAMQAGSGPAFFDVGESGGGVADKSNVVEVSELVVKEAKWFATISATLIALERSGN